MTTSNPEQMMLDLTKQADSLGQMNALAAGMPDPAVLTRMANEYFKDIPINMDAGQGVGMSPSPSWGEGLGVRGSNLSAAPIPPTATKEQGVKGGNSIPSPQQAEGIPVTLTEADLRQLTNFQELDSFTQPPVGTFSNIPSFSFLEEARSIFNMPAMKAPTTASEAISQSESALGQSGAMVPGSAFSFPKELAAPAMPGVPASMSDAERAISYDFLNNLQSLGSIEAMPTLAPFATAVDPMPSAMDISSAMFDVNAIRRDFPILNERVNGKQLIWLDNAATTQKPQAVIDRLAHFYSHENSNIHRAAHTLAARSTDAYEAAREKTRRFLNAGNINEIIFVRGTTEGINLISQSWGRKNVLKDDEIVITHLEHHANIVPWQMLCSEKGAKLRVALVDNNGQIILDEYNKLLNSKTKLVAISQVSNALGTVTPVNEMTEMAHRQGAKVLIDGAQAVSHMRVDVQEIDCDFYVFSGHKIFAPTGIGAVYGKTEVLEQMPPWQGGGNMIADVTFDKTLYHNPPLRFEAGTGNIADAVGLGAALDYIDRVGMANISRYEHDLLVYATEAMKSVPGLHLVGTAANKASVLSFVLEGYRSEDVGTALNREGIAVRAGHHCAQPILRRFGLESTVRPSLAFYNTCEEVDALIAALWNLKSGRSFSMA